MAAPLHPHTVKNISSVSNIFTLHCPPPLFTVGRDSAITSNCQHGCYCSGPAVRQLMSPICLVTAQAAWEPCIPPLEPPCFVVSQV